MSGGFHFSSNHPALRPGAGTVSYDSDAQAWFDAVVTAGGSVSVTQKGYVDTLVLALKTSSTWAKFDRLWLHGNADTDEKQATISLVNPTATASLVSTPTLTTGGWSGDGSTKYLNSNFNPYTDGVNYLRHSASVGSFVSSSSTTSDNQVSVGAYDSVTNASRANINPIFANSFYWSLNITTGGSQGDTNAQRKGLYIISRTADQVAQAYKNGATSGSNDSSLDLPPPNVPFYILGFDIDNSLAAGDSTDTVGITFFGGGLTAQNVTDISAAINAYATNLGWNY